MLKVALGALEAATEILRRELETESTAIRLAGVAPSSVLISCVACGRHDVVAAGSDDNGEPVYVCVCGVQTAIIERELESR